MSASAQPEPPAALVAAVDSLFTRVTPDLHDEVEDLYAIDIDWDDLVPDVLAKAVDIEGATRALLVFAPHLGVIEGGDL
ncbi:hypothetical protein [Streptomyces decoyicus]